MGVDSRFRTASALKSSYKDGMTKSRIKKGHIKILEARTLRGTQISSLPSFCHIECFHARSKISFFEPNPPPHCGLSMSKVGIFCFIFQTDWRTVKTPNAVKIQFAAKVNCATRSLFPLTFCYVNSLLLPQPHFLRGWNSLLRTKASNLTWKRPDSTKGTRKTLFWFWNAAGCFHTVWKIRNFSAT